MTEKSLPMGGGWAAQQQEGIEKQANLAKAKRAAHPPSQDEVVVDQEALIAGATEEQSDPDNSKDQSVRTEN